MKIRFQLIYLSSMLLISFSIIGASWLLPVRTGYAASRTWQTATQLRNPAHTTSIYEKSVSPELFQRQGCVAAQGPAGLVILDFGEPFVVQGRYGTDIFTNTFVSDDSIARAISNFISEAWICRTSMTNLKIAVGTSNYTLGLKSDLTAWFDAGYAWGRMVDNLQKFIESNGYAHQLTVYGADDMETDEAHHWGTYAETANFVDGYNAATRQLLVDFGDDPGGASPTPWTAEQLWYVASGAPDDVALPEIYYWAAARDWEALNRWSCINRGQALKIIGTIAEYPSYRSNVPAQAFTQMYSAMGTDSCTTKARSQLVYSTNIQGL